MSLRMQLMLGVLLGVSGWLLAPGGSDASLAAPAPTLPPAPDADAPAGGNLAWFEVDGEVFRFRTPEVRHSRSLAGEKVVAEHFELVRPDNGLYVRLVLQVDEDRRDLSGVYEAVSLDDAAQAGRVGVGEVVLAEETAPARGRRMLPSGSGRIEVKQADGRLKVRFSTRGDGLFRSEQAAPVTGELDFLWRP